MSSGFHLQIHRIQFSLKFIQGYRYLDRCGEALIRLENALGEGWITTEPLPTSGGLKNDTKGLTVQFNADGLFVSQMDFLSFEIFREATCIVKEILLEVFAVERINLPTVNFVLQKGFKFDDQLRAEQYIHHVGLMVPHQDIGALLGGTLGPVDFTLVTQEDRVWAGFGVHRRSRLKVAVVRQEKSLPFDPRLLSRVKNLPKNQQAAMQGLMNLRHHHREAAAIAAQFELENSFETELPGREFDLPLFLQESWAWAEKIQTELSSKAKGARE